jgi:hypothetical protein
MKYQSLVRIYLLSSRNLWKDGFPLVALVGFPCSLSLLENFSNMVPMLGFAPSKSLKDMGCINYGSWNGTGMG